MINEFIMFVGVFFSNDIVFGLIFINSLNLVQSRTIQNEVLKLNSTY